MKSSRTRKRTGGIIPLMVVILPVLLIISAFAINLCYMELVRTELQIATDAACKAAGRTLVSTGDQAQAMAAAQATMDLNTVGGSHLSLNTSSFQFGHSTRPSATNRYQFAESSNSVNAVRIRADLLMANSGGNVRFALPFASNSVNFRPIQDATSSLAELDVCLVVDRSGSMAYASNELANPSIPPASAPTGWTFGQPVPPNSRWLEAVDAVDAFLDVLNDSAQSERVGMVTYNHNPYLESDLTSGYPSLITHLDSYSSAFEAGATNIGDGMFLGLNMLDTSTNRRDWAVKVMVVLTDGIHNWGTWPTAAASAAADQDVVVYTVTFAMESDQDLMATVASMGGGRHFHATNALELTEAFETIAKDLPVLLTD